jgi:hypothetical protein
MKIKKRKQRPQPPKYFWTDTDCCWFCHGKKRNGCGGCKFLKEYNYELKSKQKIERNSIE